MNKRNTQIICFENPINKSLKECIIAEYSTEFPYSVKTTKKMTLRKAWKFLIDNNIPHIISWDGKDIKSIEVKQC